MTPKPFVKWVGGKRQIIAQMIHYVPKQFRVYHEPFLGGGALFFHLQPKQAILSDINEELIRTYAGVRNNASNQFNAPFGYYKNPAICDEENLFACSSLLAKAKLRCRDFAYVLEHAQKGDFVYFDSPYIPLSKTASFTSYTSKGFNLEDQRRLRDVALELKQRGVQILLSNSSADEVRHLYRKFDLIPIQARRAINADGAGRGAVTEFLIR
jgi:DNA adenine methylase